MKTHRLATATALSLALCLFPAAKSFAQTYTEATIGSYAPANDISKSATASPNNVATFTGAVNSAFSTNYGGVFYFPAAVPTGTLNFIGAYGTSLTKQLQITSSKAMQNVANNGTFTPIGSANATTTSTDVSSYNLTIGPITSVSDGSILTNEQVTEIGFTLLSRTGDDYPLTVEATALFSDGSSQSAITNIASPKGSDNTFYGFTAANSLSITSLVLQCFELNSTNPIANRICFDDFGFITTPTAPSTVAAAPQILNVSAFPYAILSASNGIQFQVISTPAIAPTNISLLLSSNGLSTNDVSSQLVITGNGSNDFVSYSGLVSPAIYNIVISASNAAGGISYTSTFYTAESPITLFDSGGFSDTNVYPEGALENVDITNSYGVSAWIPDANNPAQIVASGAPQYPTNLQVTQTGSSAGPIDYLQFPQLASGILRIAFDAQVSDPTQRTLDVALMPSSGGLMASDIAWGTNVIAPGSNEISYYNGTLWLPVASWDTNWHHVEMSNYLSGRFYGAFDLSVDGTLVGSKLVWKNAIVPQTPLGLLRFGAIRGLAGEYGNVDNLVLTAASAPPFVDLPVTLTNALYTGGVFSFQFQSQAGAVHVVQYSGGLSSRSWATLVTLQGDGTVMTVTNNNPSGAAQFFRVLSQ